MKVVANKISLGVESVDVHEGNNEKGLGLVSSFDSWNQEAKKVSWAPDMSSKDNRNKTFHFWWSYTKIVNQWIPHANKETISSQFRNILKTQLNSYASRWTKKFGRRPDEYETQWFIVSSFGILYIRVFIVTCNLETEKIINWKTSNIQLENMSTCVNMMLIREQYCWNLYMNSLFQ